MTACVCCDRTQEELEQQELIQDPTGEWWCQSCIETCIPYRDVEQWGEAE